MRYAKRKDNTQAEVERALQAAGWEIFDYSRVGWGVPDVIARRAGFKLWVEVKSEGESMTAAEMKFQTLCPGDVIVAHSGAEAVKLAEMAYQHYKNIIGYWKGAP